MAEERERGRGIESGVIRRILVGYDGSSEAHRALRIARSLAADVNGDVHVLSVITPRAHAETTDERQKAIEEELSRLSQFLEELEVMDDREKTPVAHVVDDDEPADAIAEFAREHGFDLVVIGTHGTDQIMHRGFGRSLEVLIKLHPCPLLIV
jgi:nucleotide-binding universal stress UspA family protein